MKHFTRAIQIGPDVQIPGVHSLSYANPAQCLASVCNQDGAEGGICIIDHGDPCSYHKEAASFYDIQAYNNGVVVRNGTTNKIEVYSVDRVKAFQWDLPQGKHHGIAVRGENLLIADTAASCVRVYKMTGELQATVTSGDMRSPRYLAATPDGFVVTCQGADYTVLHLDMEGNVIWADAEMEWPSGVAVDDNGDIWLCNCEDSTISLWTNDSEQQFTMLKSEHLGGYRPFSIAVTKGKLAVSFLDKQIVKMFELS